MLKFKSLDDVIKEKKIREFGHNPLSPGNPFPSYKDATDVKDNDVPNVMDTDYVTHVSLDKTQVPLEQDAVPPGKIQTTAPAMPPAQTGPPGAGIAPPGIDPVTGMPLPEEEGPMSPQEVGRVFELKKIHARLTSIEAYLEASTDLPLIKLRINISKALELFFVLISNLKLFKDRLDPLIVVFYKFLDQAYSILAKYYKDKDSGKDVKIPD
jgi:hypothetical protein